MMMIMPSMSSSITSEMRIIHKNSPHSESDETDVERRVENRKRKTCELIQLTPIDSLSRMMTNFQYHHNSGWNQTHSHVAWMLHGNYDDECEREHSGFN